MLAKKTIKSKTKMVKKTPTKKAAPKKSVTRKAALPKATLAKAQIKNTQPKRINAGARMSDAVIHGNTVYTSGKVASKNKGKSVTLQTKEILESIDSILKQAGTDKSKLITANIWLSKISTFQEMNKVWDAWVVPGSTPARATVEAKLADPGYTVEIMVTAAL